MEMGLLYDSSLVADDDCYELLQDGKPSGVIELPVQWIRDDAVYFGMHRFSGLRPYTPPADVLDIFLRELQGAATGRRHLPADHASAYHRARSRIWIPEEVIRRRPRHWADGLPPMSRSYGTSKGTSPD